MGWLARLPVRLKLKEIYPSRFSRTSHSQRSSVHLSGHGSENGNGVTEGKERGGGGGGGGGGEDEGECRWSPIGGVSGNTFAPPPFSSALPMTTTPLRGGKWGGGGGGGGGGQPQQRWSGDHWQQYDSNWRAHFKHSTHHLPCTYQTEQVR